MLKPTKILVPTDFSGYSDAALKQAVDIAEEYGAELHVLHVVEVRIHSMYEYEFAGKTASAAGIRRLESKMVKTAEIRMQEYLAKPVAGKKVKVIPRVVKGNPIKEILKFQNENGIDLIVISSLGHSGLAEYFIGGVARNVLKGSTCPVLLTKG